MTESMVMFPPVSARSAGSLLRSRSCRDRAVGEINGVRGVVMLMLPPFVPAEAVMLLSRSSMFRRIRCRSRRHRLEQRMW